jgi:hypothetical protein
MPTTLYPLPGNILDDPNFFPIWRYTRYIDKEGSPEMSLFFDRGQILRTIWVHHAAVEQAITDFCGTVAIMDAPGAGTGVRTLTRSIPHAYPKWPKMFVQGVNSVNPHAMRPKEMFAPATLQDHQARDTDDTPLYHVAEMVLQYVMPSFRITDDNSVTSQDDADPLTTYPDEGWALSRGLQYSRYITRQIKGMNKMLTIPRGILKTTDGKAVLEAIAVNEHVAEYSYTWHQVPEEALPQLTWIEATNVVNDATFDLHPPGTLLFCGDPDLRMNPSPITGQYLYDVTYRFHSLRIVDEDTSPMEIRGHNYIRKVVSGKLRPVLFASDGIGGTAGTRVYRDYDFRKLFRPDVVAP